MSDRWNSANLHEELALYYHQFRNVDAPRNSFTEGIWLKILQAEAKEAKASARA